MNFKKTLSLIFFLICIIFIINMLFRIFINLDVNNITSDSCKVSSKYLDVDKTYKHDVNEYTVVTSCGIYNIRNNQLINQSDSDSLYQSISVGKTYDINSVSYNIPTFSLHPRIIKIREHN